MTKTFRIIAVIFLSAVSIFPFGKLSAQRKYVQPQFRLGFSGELAQAKFGGIPPEDAQYESVTGFGGALIGEMRIVKDVYLSIQPGYHTKGSRIIFGNEENLINDTTVKYILNQSSFSIPVNVKFYRGSLYVGGGVIFDFLTSSNYHLDKTPDNKIDNKDAFKSFDAIADFNIGYDFCIGKPTLFVELRYLQGLTNINTANKTASDEVYFANFKSKGFSLNAGLLFPFK